MDLLEVHACLLLSCYSDTTAQAGLILTHQTPGNQPSSQASPSARELKALRSRHRAPQVQVSRELRPCCLHFLPSAFQMLFWYRHLTELSRTVLILKYILENNRKYGGLLIILHTIFHRNNNSQITKTLGCVWSHFTLNNNRGLQATPVLTLKTIVLTGKSTKVQRLWLQENLPSKAVRASTNWNPRPVGPGILWCAALLSHSERRQGRTPKQFHRYANGGRLHSRKKHLPLREQHTVSHELMYVPGQKIKESSAR